MWFLERFGHFSAVETVVPGFADRPDFAAKKTCIAVISLWRNVPAESYFISLI
jgi:hypothetical protein